MTDVISHLRESGFNDDEISQWAVTTRQNLTAAGFNDDEVNDYLGVPKAPGKVPDAFIQRFEAGKKLVDFYKKIVPEANQHQIEAATTGAIEGFGSEPLGVDPAKERQLYNALGIPEDIQPLVMNHPSAQFLKGGAAAFDLLMRGTNAGIRSIAELAGETGKELGQNPAMAERMKRDINSLGQIALLLAGPMHADMAGMQPTRVTAGPARTSAIEQIGGLPKGEDFSTASTVIGHGDTTPAMEGKLLDLYEKKGIHPSEVAHDAQTDPTITQSMLSLDKEDMPAGYGFTPSQMKRLLDAEQEQLIGMWHTAKEPLPEGASDHYRSVVQGYKRELERTGIWQARTEQEALDILFEKRGERVKATGSETVDVSAGREQKQIEGPVEHNLTERQPISAGAAATPPPAYSDAENQILSKISVDQKSPERALTWDRAYTETMDRLFPIAKAVKESGFADLPAESNPYNLARLMSGAGGKADHFLNHGTFDFHTYENNGPSLKQILAPVKGDLNGFRAYATAARAIELETRGIKSGFAEEGGGAPPLISSGLDAARTVVVEGRERFEQPFRALIDYQNKVSGYLRDSGVLSDAGYKAMVEANKMFVPFTRVMGIEDKAFLRGGSTLQASNPVKAIKGSARDIVDPLESIIRNTYHMINMAEKNVVGTKLIDMLKRAETEMPELPRATELKASDLKTPDADKVLSKLITESNGLMKKHDRTVAKFGDNSPEAASALDDVMRSNRRIKELQESQAAPPIPESARAGAMAEELGAAGVKAPADLAAALDHASAPLREGEIAILRDGKRETFNVDPDLARAMKGLDAQAMGMFERLLAKPASWLRAGSVLTPQFWARHVLRDYMYATATSTPERGLFTPWDMAKGFAGLIVKDADYWNWLKGGGGNVAVASLDRQYLQENLRKLTGETGLVGRAWNVLADPSASMWEKTTAVPKLPFQAIGKFVLDPLRVGTEIAENASHLAAFKKGMRQQEAALDTGAPAGSLRDQIIRAGWASRDTAVDAARMGASMRAYNQIISFGNIKLQDTDRVVRAFKDNPITATALITGAITVPSVILWSLNHDDPDYQQIPQWQRDMFFIVPVGSTDPSPLHLEQAQQRGEAPKPSAKVFLRLPKPWAMGMIFGSGVERLLEAYKGENPEPFKDFLHSLWHTSGPDFLPTATAPIAEQFANRSTFTNRTLIPAAQEKFLPEYQYTPYTTELTKSLGQIIGAFPGMDKMKMESAAFGGGPARALTSPILMENYIRGWTGQLGTYALQAADAGLRKAGVLPDPPQPARTLADIPIIQAFVVRYPSASAESVQTFQDEYAKNKAFFTTYMAMAKDGNVAAMEHIQKMGGPMMFAQLDGIHEAVAEHTQIIRNIYKNPDVPPDEKRQLIDQMYFNMIQISHHGMGVIRNLREQAADTVPTIH